MQRSGKGGIGHGDGDTVSLAVRCPLSTDKGIPLGQQFRHGTGTTDEQREPRHVTGFEGVILRRDQLAPDDPVARPARIDQVAVPVDAQQLEGGIRHPVQSGFPLADGAQRHAEEVGDVITGHLDGTTSLPELLTSDLEQARATAPAYPLGGFAHFA
jgi:hypothetical protein